MRQMTMLLIFAHLDVFNVVCFRLDSLSEFKIFLAFKDTCVHVANIEDIIKIMPGGMPATQDIVCVKYMTCNVNLKTCQ